MTRSYSDIFPYPLIVRTFVSFSYLLGLSNTPSNHVFPLILAPVTLFLLLALFPRSLTVLGWFTYFIFARPPYSLFSWWAINFLPSKFRPYSNTKIVYSLQLNFYRPSARATVLWHRYTLLSMRLTNLIFILLRLHTFLLLSILIRYLFYLIAPTLSVFLTPSILSEFLTLELSRIIFRFMISYSEFFIRVFLCIFFISTFI